MRRTQTMLLLLLIALFGPTRSQAQLWTGVIDPSRASNWANAGVIGGIPSGTWTQCGSTIAPYNGTTDTINNAIAACGANQYVQLGAGTFNLTSGGSTSGGIVFKKSKVLLRGAGANQTFLIFASGAYDSCSGGYHAAICLNGSQGGWWVSDPAVNWTAGYAQGTSVITLASTSGITPNSTVVGLDQCSESNSGSPCSATGGVDDGNYFDCDIEWASGTGCAINGPDGGNQRLNRPQNELYQVSAVNSSTGQVTLIGSLRAPNWNPARTPQAYIAQTIQYSGVENLSVDTSNDANIRGVVLYYTANCWVHGLRIVKPYYSGIFVIVGVHDTVEQNYIYGTSGALGADIFGINFAPSSDNLIQNNIVQAEQVGLGNEGADSGSVWAYNFIVNDFNDNDGIYPSIFPHAGDRYQLFEGNIANSYYAENYHGPKLMNTLFRNFFTAWESCANGNCGSSSSKASATTAVRLVESSRYHNVIANVLGTPGVNSTYKTTGGFAAGAIYEMGSGNGSIPSDPIVGQTSFFWGNYDVVTDGVRWCGNSSDASWANMCGGASEVPTSFSLDPQPMPTKGDTATGMGALPASLYLSAKPAWWGSVPWPAIGPDVTGGSVGQCAGSLNVSGQFNGVAATSSSQCKGSSLTTSAWGGHVNATPAMNCFLNVMGGVPDGTNGLLNFSASSCYTGGSSAPPPPPAPAPPTSLVAVPSGV